ncbi:MAG: prefoldin subunit alpha [Candidatus Marsarchaeota archaeon]|jgi:fused signal recognition particle receptor
MSEEKDEFQRLSDQYVYLESLLKALSDQERLIATYVQETEGALSALKSLKEGFLAPVGAGVFVQSAIAGEKVFVSLGQSVFVERPKDEAISYLEKRRDELRKSVEALELRERQTIGALRSMEPRIRQLASKLGLARMVFEGLKRAFSRLSKNDVKEARSLLLEAGVALDVVEQIEEQVKERPLAEVLYGYLAPLASPDFPTLIKRKGNWPYVTVFFGVNGVGKTTALAKVGKYLKDSGLRPYLVPGDTFRAGAIEQLTAHANKLALPYLPSKYGADPASLVFEAKKLNSGKELTVILVDTAGRVEMDKNLMDQMKKIVRVGSPDLKVLVVDALTGNAVLKQVEGYESAVGVDAFLVTKVDADAKGGVFLSLSRYKKPILFISRGQEYDSLDRFDPKNWVEALVGPAAP